MAGDGQDDGDQPTTDDGVTDEVVPAPRHRRRLVVFGVVAVLLVAGAIGGWFWLRRDTSRPVTIQEAKDRLTSTTGGGTSVPDTAAPRPEAGVYEYRGSGAESLSRPPLEQDQGPTIPATVELGKAGCWTIRFDYSTNHWQTWSYCRRGADLVETGGKTWQRWMIGATAITNLTTSTCEDAMVLPNSRKPGQEWTARCVSANEAVDGEAVSEGPYTYVRDETLTVGGDKVKAARFVRKRKMSGSQEGTERSEVWFAVDTGLPIRNERRISVDTDTPIGTSTYAETGEWSLTSLEPTT